MDRQRWLDDYLARVRAVRWLQPDAGMDALDESARRWIDERVEEHAVALSHVNRGEAVTLAWGATRMVDEARTRSGHVNYATESLVTYALPALAWLSLLDDARSLALDRAREVLGPARRLEVAEAVWALLRGPAARSREEAYARYLSSDRESSFVEVRGPEDYVVGTPGARRW